MRKKFIPGVLIILIIFVVSGICLRNNIRVKNAKVEVVLEDDIKIKFNDTKKVSDYIKSINGKIVDDYLIDTSDIGVQTIKFSFINEDGVKISYSYDVEVVDVTKPIIWLSTSYRIAKGTEFNTNSVLCGDDYDPEPKCYIEGNYDINTIGEYPLVFKAEDSSGNTSTQNFVLKVYEPKTKSENTKTEKIYTNFKDVVDEYKTSNIKIGIDVSRWQEDIDFSKLKKSGVEFVIIRIGGTIGTDGEYFLDKNFINNIKGAKANNIPVGIYFYSYANSKESAIKDAEWVIEQLNDYEVELPIAFDWEEWSSFNEYNLSFFGLTNVAEAFLNRLDEAGYEGMIYSSKLYLERIWFPTEYDIWLAHYTNDTNYQGKYRFWQMCDNGKVDGINGAVDIDIMYY